MENTETQAQEATTEDRELEQLTGCALADLVPADKQADPFILELVMRVARAAYAQSHSDMACLVQDAMNRSQQVARLVTSTTPLKPRDGRS